MTKDLKPLKLPKGNVLIEFLVDSKQRKLKGVRKITNADSAKILVDAKKAKIVKEYALGEIADLAKKGVDYMTPDKK